jgi:hypothetical protein
MEITLLAVACPLVVAPLLGTKTGMLQPYQTPPGVGDSVEVTTVLKPFAASFPDAFQV